jgi:membrane protein DedA with SNARE-associated domain
MLNTGLLILAITTTIKSILSKSLYPGMLLCLIAASLGVPIPEDVPLILGGALCRLQDGEIYYAILIGMIGVLSGDIVLYYAGRRFGLDILKKKPFSYLVTTFHIEQMQGHFKKRGNWIIFFGRFFAGVRAVMCVTSGICRVPAWKFVLIDFSGALISVPFLVGLGWWFSNHFEAVLKKTMSIERIVGAMAVIILLIWFTFIYFKHRRKRKLLEQNGGIAPDDSNKDSSV